MSYEIYKKIALDIMDNLEKYSLKLDPISYNDNEKYKELNYGYKNRYFIRKEIKDYIGKKIKDKDVNKIIDITIIKIILAIHFETRNKPHPVCKHLYVIDTTSNDLSYETIDNFCIQWDARRNMPSWFGKRTKRIQREKKCKNILREQNIKLIRLMNSGNDTIPIKCSYTGKNVEEWADEYYKKDTMMFFDMHHIVFKSRRSMYNGKETKRSNSIISSRISYNNIKELFECVPINKGHHFWMHKKYVSGDLNWWLSHWKDHGHIPYFLRSRLCFEEITQELGIELEWNDFYPKLFLNGA